MLKHIPNNHWQLNAQQELDIKRLAILSAATQASDHPDISTARQHIIKACTALENQLKSQAEAAPWSIFGLFKQSPTRQPSSNLPANSATTTHRMST